MSFEIGIETLADITHGVGITLGLMSCALTLSWCLCGVLCAWYYTTDNKWIMRGIASFQHVMRGTPLITQIFLIYYGTAELPWLRHSWAWTWFQSPFFCAALALGLNSAAYLSVALQAAVDRKHEDLYASAHTLGLTKFQIWRKILYPLSMRELIPYGANEVVIICKATALASTISLMDIMGVIRHLMVTTYQPMAWLCVASGLYLMFNMFFLGCFHALEHYDNQRKSPTASHR